MKISVILPIYNGHAYLHQAIASILSQDADMELIISDDNSSDDSLAIAEAFSDHRIRILRNQQNSGIFGNLNRCINESRGELIQIFSQDDVMLPGYLASQAALLVDHPTSGLVYGTPRSINEKGHELPDNRIDRTPQVIRWPLYLWLSSHYGALPASISSVMIPRRTFDTVGLFDPTMKMAGDLEFYNRVAERFTILRNSEILHLVRSHSGMASISSAAGRTYLKEEARLAEWYKKYWGSKEWNWIRRFRALTRASYHLGWIRRALRRGEFRVTANALIELHGLYPLHVAFAGILSRLLVDHTIFTPSVPCPGESDTTIR